MKSRRNKARVKCDKIEVVAVVMRNQDTPRRTNDTYADIYKLYDFENSRNIHIPNY